MYYVVVKQSPMYHQMTLEEFLFQENTTLFIRDNKTNTRTYEVETVSDVFKKTVDIPILIKRLTEFNARTEDLRKAPRHELYREFRIPKRSGGLRRIDAPNKELSDALRDLKNIFEDDFHALYHTSAFAYIKGRSTVDCVKRHQENESKWYAKYDLTNLFGSTTLDFVLNMFSMVFPFSEVMKDEDGFRQLETALELAFLDGGLPQGTPVSPIITNIMMIPIDYKLANKLRDFDGQRYIYTRYADDFEISSKYEFSFQKIEDCIVGALAEFNAPFQINHKKTRYGSSSGQNWCLGIMLNGENKMTVGHKKKRQFEAMLSSYIMDKKNGIQWDLNDVQVMEGYRNYYRMVEGETIDRIVGHIDQKFGVDVVRMIKDDLKGKKVRQIE